MTPDLADEKERLSALDTTHSHHVEAPAGSGKTLLLTMRFLKLLGEVNHPGEIVALTFTEKAAGEMRNRIIRILNRAQDGEIPENHLDETLLKLAGGAISRHHHHKNLFASSDLLNIMTFHGFCLYMVKRAPLQAGISPDCEIMEEETLPILMDEALRRVRDRLFSAHKGDTKRTVLENRLLYHNNNWNSVSEELKEIIKTRDRFEDLIMEVSSHGVSTMPSILSERLQMLIQKNLNTLREKFSSSGLGAKWKELIDHLSGKGAAVDDLPSLLPGPLWEELADWQAIANRTLTREGSPRKQFGPKNGFYTNFKETTWAELIQSMPEDVVKALHETRNYPVKGEVIADTGTLSDLIILAAEVIGEYEAICRKKHVIDFIGLEQSAIRLFNEEDPSDLHLYLDHRIRHLLIDEFQDTSRNQWELVKRLCSGWAPGDGRTIFIVGDPKQSIYAFRKAEVRLFMESKSGIPTPGQGKIPVDVHLLKTNFRSTQGLIRWINSLFGNIVMNNPDTDADEVPFNPSVPSKDVMEKAVISLNLFSNEDTDRAKDNEARWLAEKVKKMLDETEDRSIAILLFTRNRIRSYLTALKEEHIPVQVQEGLSFANRPEVMHLMRIAKALTMPHDDISWASLLRSPWSWFDIKVLREVSIQEGDTWAAKIRLTAKRHPEMNFLVKAIDNALRRVGRDKLGSCVKRFWEDLDGPRITAYLYGMAGVANCLRFLEILENVEEGIPQETLSRFEVILDSIYEPTDPTTSGSQVQIMTIHRAKGLEFDCVFIPFMDWKPLSSGPRTPPPYLLERIPGYDDKYLIAMGKDRRTEKPELTYRLLEKIRKERAWGEAKRLFYVATTRARDTLIMSGVVKTKDDAFFAPEKSILGWVMDHEKINGKSPAEIRSDTISITLNPTIHDPYREDRSNSLILPDPIKLSPESIPYIVKVPSSVKSNNFSYQNGYEAEDRTTYGIITHRILHTLITGGRMPAESAVAKAICAEGLSPDAAFPMASEIIREVTSTLSDPFIAKLVDKNNPVVKSEWAIEDMPEQKHIRSGVIDLAVFDGNDWWIVDFKTSRPAKEEPFDDFISREAEFFEPQLNAYRSMLESVKSSKTQVIHTGIYFTALKQWIEV